MGVSPNGRVPLAVTDQQAEIRSQRPVVCKVKRECGHQRPIALVTFPFVHRPSASAPATGEAGGREIGPGGTGLHPPTKGEPQLGALRDEAARGSSGPPSADDLRAAGRATEGAYDELHRDFEGEGQRQSAARIRESVVLGSRAGRVRPGRSREISRHQTKYFERARRKRPCGSEPRVDPS